MTSPCQVFVGGIPPGKDPDVLRMFFEAESKSGGGPIAKFDFEPEQNILAITYHSPTVAARVLSKGTLEFSGAQLTLSTPSTVVEVFNVALGEEELAEMYFSVPGRSGGGPVDKQWRDERTGNLMVKFQNAQDASCVARKRKHCPKSGVEWTAVATASAQVSSSRPQRQAQLPARLQRGASQESGPPIPPPDEDFSSRRKTPGTIQVTSLPPGANQQFLKGYFEKPEKCDGGPVTKVEIGKDRVALVTFEDISVAKRVAARSKLKMRQREVSVRLYSGDSEGDVGGSVGRHSAPLSPTGQQQQFQQQHFQQQQQQFQQQQTHDTSPDSLTIPSEENKDILALKVDNLGPVVDSEMLQMFLDKRLGDIGKVNEIWLDRVKIRGPFEAVVTFSSTAAVDAIIASRPHRFGGRTLQFSRLSAPSPTVTPQSQCLPKRFVLQGLRVGTSDADLREFMKKYSNLQVTHVAMDVSGRNALVQFAKPEFPKLCEVLRVRPINGAMITPQKVPIPTCVQVWNTGGLDTPALQAYFCNKAKSGGGPLASITGHQSGCCQIVTFKDLASARSVWQKPTHLLDGRALFVMPYYKEMGPISPDQSFPNVPGPLIVKDMPEEILQFVARSKKWRGKLEEKLAGLKCIVKWEKGPSMQGLILCCSTGGFSAIDPAKVKPLHANWEGNVRAKTAEFLNQFSTKDFSCAKEIWSTFKRNAANLLVTDPENDEIHVEVTKGQPKVKVTGVSTKVDQSISDLQRSLNIATEQANTLKVSEATETLNKLRQSQIQLMKACHIENTLGQKYKGLKVVYYDDLVELKGNADHVNHAKLDVYETLQDAVSEFVAADAGRLQLLREPQAKSAILSELQKKGVKLGWDEKPDGISLCAMQPADLETGKRVLQEILIRDFVDIPPASESLVQGDGWETFLQSISSTHKGLYHIAVYQKPDTSYQVELTTLAGRIHDAIKQEFKGYVDQNSVLKRLVPTKRGLARFIDRHCQKDILRIEHTFSYQSVGIESKLDGDNPGFVIHGTIPGIQSAIKQLKIAIAKVIEEKHKIIKPVTKKLFSSPKGHRLLKGIEASHKIAIEIQQKVAHTSKPSIAPAKPTGPMIVAAVKLTNNIVLYLEQGDILAKKVDVIVNAANGDLHHYGGLAKELSERGGPTIQEECSRYVKEKGKVLEGSFFISGPGTLPCKQVIHAVGPTWSGGQKGERNLLANVVLESLQVTQSHHHQSIAFPALSMGIFGYPKNEGCEAIVEAIAMYCRMEPVPQVPKEIYLIDIKPDITDSFRDALQKALGAMHVITDPGLVGAVRGQAPAIGTQGVPPQHANSGIHAFGSIPQPNQSNTITLNNGLTISFRHGSITNEQVDAIVSSTTWQPPYNPLSASVVQAAGDQVKRELGSGKKRKQTVNPAVIASTSGGSLFCKSIYHGSLSTWNGRGGAAEMKLRRFINQCFQTAINEQHGSIGFPPVGTGNANIPCNEWATIFYQEACSLMKGNLGNLKYVVITMPEMDKLQIIQSTIMGVHGSGNITPREKKLRHAMSVQDTSGESDEMDSLGTLYGDQLHMQFGAITLIVKHGDLTMENADAIVNSASRDFSMQGTGAVEKAILKAGGPAIAADVATKDKSSPVIVTNAGNLKCRNVIHIGSGDKCDLSSLTTQALQQAENLEMGSVAFPALGTGQLAMEGSKSVSSMLKGLAAFAQSSPKCVKTVHFIIYQHHMLSTFQETIKREAAQVLQKRQGKQTQGWKLPLFGRSASQPSSGLEAKVLQQPEDLTLLLYASDKKDIALVIEELDQVCETEMKDVVLDDPQDQDLIKKLSSAQVQQILELRETSAVDISIEKTPFINRIRIRGDYEDTLETMGRVRTLLQEADSFQQMKSEAELMQQETQWQYKDDDGTFKDYPPEVNLQLEKAQHRRLGTYEWSEGGDTFRVNFQNMTEVVVTDPTAPAVPVNRKAKTRLPANWDPMHEGTKYVQVPLPTNSPDYIKVEQMFRTSLAGTAMGPTVKIERIQNPSLYGRYTVHKHHMEQQLTGTGSSSQLPVERILWHGTSANSVPNISAYGMNRSYCGKNATAYGNGVYFAVNASYSASQTYSPTDHAGVKRMFLCRVLTGTFTKGAQGMIDTPPKDQANPTDRYDSVVDNTANPTMFIIFSDTQAYPEFLLTFRQK